MLVKRNIVAPSPIVPVASIPSKPPQQRLQEQKAKLADMERRAMLQKECSGCLKSGIQIAKAKIDRLEKEVKNANRPPKPKIV